jgi:predicted enzyme related to lactoylglutathione lyase
MAAKFFWYELLTTDVDAAVDFYRAVVGWTPQPMGPADMPYVVQNVGDRGVAGITSIPPGMGNHPAWVGYIYSADVDSSVSSLEKAGGKVIRPGTDIPDIGRFAVVTDPQGTIFMLMKPMGDDQPPVPLGTPGHVGWHELYATDWQKAFDFYASQFGWNKTTAMDMGPMGTYQLFNAGGGDDIGGMMNKPENIPMPVWSFYFNVPDINVAANVITDKGGSINMGPMEVPGGGWIIMGTDPQGAAFAVTAPF